MPSRLRGRIDRNGGSIDLHGPAYVIVIALIVIAIVLLAMTLR
jgi:preprotein translocase subunit Sec61beta